ncbi:hypothetical protein [Pseudomonas azotoformans]|uniref:hypothetical protein n=1 Tax=Pseudomonas azotoformans TaxID=47878 RepID=UPI0011461E95|nr:hypothetical protein [Pseudomonas azotoformans]QDH64170.1 hypothetical protein FKZ69_09160 [Pseudomonas azotoformans]
MGISEEKDKLLCAVLAHESILCKKAYEEFFDIEFQLAHGGNSVEQIILAHGAFQSFIHHLYEFCIALIQRDQNSLDQIIAADAEKHIMVALEKAWHMECKNPISYFYKMTATEFYGSYSCFPKHFRQARNNSAHALIKRAKSGQPLAEFYSLYRMALKLLFSHLTQWWQNIDIEQTNWHDIGKFDIHEIAMQDVHEHLVALGMTGLAGYHNK